MAFNSSTSTLNVVERVSTFGQLLERWLLLLPAVVLGLLWQEVLLLRHRSELRTFTRAFFLPLFGQRPWQQPEGDTRQQDHSAGHDEAQPPGPHPAGVLVIDSDGV